MYRVTVDGKVISYTDKLHYVRRSDSTGWLEPASPAGAAGIVVNSVAYSLVGLPAQLEGAPIAVVTSIDTGEYLNTLTAQNIEAQQQITELDLQNIEAQQQITELELQILEG